MPQTQRWKETVIFKLSLVPVSRMDWKWDNSLENSLRRNLPRSRKTSVKSWYLRNSNASEWKDNLPEAWRGFGGWFKVRTERKVRKTWCVWPARDHAQTRNLRWKHFLPPHPPPTHPCTHIHTHTHREIPGLSRRGRKLRSLENLSVYHRDEWVNEWMNSKDRANERGQG